MKGETYAIIFLFFLFFFILDVFLPIAEQSENKALQWRWSHGCDEKGGAMSLSKRFSINLIKDDLADYGFYLLHRNRQRARIAQIEEEMYNIKAVSYSTVPASGGTSRQEDRMIDLITRKKKLEDDIANGEKLDKEFQDYLSLLNERERDIIMTLWVYRERNGVKNLTEKYAYSPASIYRISDNVLGLFARIRYGVKE